MRADSSVKRDMTGTLARPVARGGVMERSRADPGLIREYDRATVVYRRERRG